MTDILFYEKPGCINGGKQKKILEAAGHCLECKNILEEKWTNEKLLPFIEGKEPSTMMNHTAPAIKNGEITPDQLSFTEAMELMLDSPILIKRPLIFVDNKYIQGFTHPDLIPYLGDWAGKEDVTTCPKINTISCDEETKTPTLK